MKITFLHALYIFIHWHKFVNPGTRVCVQIYIYIYTHKHIYIFIQQCKKNTVIPINLTFIHIVNK